MHHNATVAQGSKKQNQLCDLDAYIKGTENVTKDVARATASLRLTFDRHQSMDVVMTARCFCCLVVNIRIVLTYLHEYLYE